MDKKQEEMVSDWRIKRMKTSEKIAENKDWMWKRRDSGYDDVVVRLVILSSRNYVQRSSRVWVIRSNSAIHRWFWLSSIIEQTRLTPRNRTRNGLELRGNVLFANLLIPIHEITTGRRQKRVFAKPLLPCILLFCLFRSLYFLFLFLSFSLSIPFLSLNPQRVLLRKSRLFTTYFRKLTFVETCTRDIGTEEEIEHLFESWIGISTSRKLPEILVSNDESREIRMHSQGFWLEPSVEIGANLSSKEREHLSLVWLIVATLLFWLTIPFSNIARREIGSFFAGKRKKKNF